MGDDQSFDKNAIKGIIGNECCAVVFVVLLLKIVAYSEICIN